MNGIVSIVAGLTLYAFSRCEAVAELAVIVFLIMLMVRSMDSPFDSDSFDGLITKLLLRFHFHCFLSFKSSRRETGLCCIHSAIHMAMELS